MYSFSYLEPVCCSMSSSNCCFLTYIQISQKAGKVVWYSHLFQNFPQFLVIHTVKGFDIVNKAEINVFLELSSFFNNPLDHRESQGIPEKKHLILLHWLKHLTVWITTNCGKFLKRWDYPTTLPASCETCMQLKKQQLELDMKKFTGSKLGKEYVKAVYCHPAYLTYMESTSWEKAG